MDQIDIFGETQAVVSQLAPRDASVPQGVQSRLFEPQMEGQLPLETERPAEAGRPDATTTKETSTGE